MLEYWRGPKGEYSFPTNIKWKYKTETDLYEFVKVTWHFLPSNMVSLITEHMISNSGQYRQCRNNRTLLMTGFMGRTLCISSFFFFSWRFDTSAIIWRLPLLLNVFVDRLKNNSITAFSTVGFRKGENGCAIVLKRSTNVFDASGNLLMMAYVSKRQERKKKHEKA